MGPAEQTGWNIPGRALASTRGVSLEKEDPSYLEKKTGPRSHSPYDRSDCRLEPVRIREKAAGKWACWEKRRKTRNACRTHTNK